MNLNAIRKVLEENPDCKVDFAIKNKQIPCNFHLTEVGKVSKIFMDCGGTRRESSCCVLQVWVADDIHHRINADKMLKILKLADQLFSQENPEVQVEYEDEVISQYPVSGFDISKDRIRFHLGLIHTACLAPEKCGCLPVQIKIKGENG